MVQRTEGRGTGWWRKGRLPFLSVCLILFVGLLFIFTPLGAEHISRAAERKALSDEATEPGVITDPGGSVKGLPSGLTILDSDGNDVPEDGIYYFHVVEMNPGETYTKEISVMNLRDDGKSYHIYFYMEPVSNKDDGIDLLVNCREEISLNGQTFYAGNVWGDPEEGYAKVTKDHPYDLGLYEVGDTRTFTASITWNGMIGSPDLDREVDKGYRIIDKDNYDDPDSQWVRRPEENATAYGEVLFHWVFYAEVQEESTETSTNRPGDSETGDRDRQTQTGDSTPLVLFILLMAVSLVVIILLLLIKQKNIRKLNKLKGSGNTESVDADAHDDAANSGQNAK